MIGARLNSSVALWLEPVTLLEASRRAGRLSEPARTRMTPWVEAAQARFRVARELRDLQTQRVALGLLQQACFFALCALEAAGSAFQALPRSVSEAWQRFDARVESSPSAPEGMARVRAAFSVEDPLSLDQMDPALANELRLTAESTVAWLLSLSEIRKPAQLARARFARCTLALLGLVALAVGLVAYWFSLSAIEPR